MRSLREWLENPEAVSDLSPEAIAVWRGELAKADTLLLAGLLAKGNTLAPAPPDRLLTTQEAAARLSVSQDHLYRCAANYPFTVRLGRRLRFSAAGIDRYIRNYRANK